MSFTRTADHITITSLANATKAEWGSVPQGVFWNKCDEPEPRRHRIHAYPARFPAFIASKAFAVASERGLKVKRVADVFCGCGTVAYEARREGIAFWGCDINPVATLIARTKSGHYVKTLLERYMSSVLDGFDERQGYVQLGEQAGSRISYWFDEDQREDLSCLLHSIRASVPQRSKYREFFLCAFSNILKATSRWLTKSIKPQLDPQKRPASVRSAFVSQFDLMLKAFQSHEVVQTASSAVMTGDVLQTELPSDIDLIITSPPYVTSYEYADLHQLSSLWLGFADDYRDLREGSIGSSQHNLNFDRESKRLNQTAGRVVFSLYDKDRAIAKAVANYYLDMQNVAIRCRRMLRKRGLAFFVIGDTEYKGVRVENSLHLTEALLAAGFRSVTASKRAVTGKILTPYRSPEGKFTRSRDGRHVYGEEFVLMAER